MANFNEINTVGKGQDLIKAATPLQALINARYIAGDHLGPRAEEWIGPPLPLEAYAPALQSLKKTWVPVPVVNEMVEGHVSGAVGREPAFEMMLTRELPEGETEYKPDEVQAKKEVDTNFGNWWDSRNSLEVIQEWTSKLKWAGRGVLRLFVPPDLMTDTGDGLEVPATTVEDALKFIYLESPPVESATTYRDRRSMREVGLYRYDEKTETVTGRNTTVRRLEMVFVQDTGETVMRLIEDKTIVAEISLSIGGFSLMYEGKASMLLTEPVIRNQRALNLTNTMLPLNAAYAGFRKQDYFNVDQPSDAEGDDTNATSGPAQLGFWYSRAYKDDQGKTQYFPPVLITTDPVDSKPLRDDIAHYDLIIRRACKQEHTVTEGTDAESAVSRIQKRAVFLLDLLQTTPVVEGALRWLQPAVYCFALYLCGKASEIPTFLEQFRPHAQCKPYTGPLTPDEVTILIQLYKENLMSAEMVALLYGTEDVEAEIARIEAAQGSNIEFQMSRAELFNAWHASLDKESAAQLAKLSDDEMAIITAATEKAAPVAMVPGRAPADAAGGV